MHVSWDKKALSGKGGPELEGGAVIDVGVVSGEEEIGVDGEDEDLEDMGMGNVDVGVDLEGVRPPRTIQRITEAAFNLSRNTFQEAIDDLVAQHGAEKCKYKSSFRNRNRNESLKDSHALLGWTS